MKPAIKICVVSAALFGAAAPSLAQQAGGAGPSSAKAALQDASGTSAGWVNLTQHRAGLVVHGELSGLPSGWHAIHIHQTGQCEPPFKSAGEHLAAGDQRHGFGEGGPHAGDLGNIWVANDGTAKFQTVTDRLALRADLTASTDKQGMSGSMSSDSVATVLDDDGAAVVVHAEPDDYQTNPGGGAGDRIACGVFR